MIEPVQQSLPLLISTMCCGEREGREGAGGGGGGGGGREGGREGGRGPCKYIWNRGSDSTLHTSSPSQLHWKAIPNTLTVTPSAEH